MSTKLHVGNISSTVAEDDLKATFGRFGQVETVEIARDAGTGRSRVFAIVAMTMLVASLVSVDLGKPDPNESEYL